MKFRRLLFRTFIHLLPYWYALTQLFTRKPGARVKPAFTHREISERMGWGDHYEADRLGGLLDTMTHPARVQETLDVVGDCDDHASYRAACLLKMGGIQNVRLGIVRYDNTGHVVVLWEDEHNQRYWADYGWPQLYHGDGWVEQVVGERQLRNAAEIEVVRLSRRDGLVFGGVRVVYEASLSMPRSSSATKADAGRIASAVQICSGVTPAMVMAGVARKLSPDCVTTSINTR